MSKKMNLSDRVFWVMVFCSMGALLVFLGVPNLLAAWRRAFDWWGR